MYYVIKRLEISNSSVSTSFMSPAKNSVLSMPFAKEFTRASSIASDTYSIQEIGNIGVSQPFVEL